MYWSSWCLGGLGGIWKGGGGGVVVGGRGGGNRYFLISPLNTAGNGSGGGLEGLSATDLTELAALDVVVGVRCRGLRSLRGDDG